MSYHLRNTRIPDSSWCNLSFHGLTRVLRQSLLLVSKAAMIDLWEERHHLGVDHRREQLRMERRMTEPFFEATAFTVSAFRMNLALGELVRISGPELELFHHGPDEDDLEECRDEDWGKSRYPVP